MTGVVKGAIAAAVVVVLAVGGEGAYLYHRNHADQAEAPARAEYKSDPDDLVYLKHEHPMNLKDEKNLKGQTLWMSAGGQLDYYPYNGHAVDYAHTQGVLLGAEPIVVADAVEATAPKSAAFRIPQGDKQVLLVFTKPGDARQYAVPVGFRTGTDYSLSTDDIFFYQDPRQLFSYWGPQVWAAIDAHKAIAGMTEREVQMALGQVSDPSGDTIGERSVTYDDQGHPKVVVFRGGKAVSIVDGKS